MKKYILIILILVLSCSQENDMNVFNLTLPTSGPGITPTFAKELFGVQTPLVTFSSYRLGGGFKTANGTIISMPTAFFDSDNSDGEPSDIIGSRSFDEGDTWVDSQVIVPNNNIPGENSRAYSACLVEDVTAGRLYVIYTTIDTLGNLTALITAAGSVAGAGDYVEDILIMYSDDYDTPGSWTVSNAVSIRSVFENQLSFEPLLVLAGPGNGIQITNGLLVFPFYYMLSNDTINWRMNQGLVYATPAELLNDITDLTAIETLVGNTSNETSIVELAPNRVGLNSRRGSNEPRSMWEIDLPGSTFIQSPSQGDVIGFGCFADWERIYGLSQPLYLFSNVTLTDRSRTAVFATVNPDSPNWVEVYELHNTPIVTIPTSRGYSNIIHGNGKTVAIFESHGTDSLPSSLGFVNLTQFHQQFLDAAIAAQP